jgi:hypothetical protein
MEGVGKEYGLCMWGGGGLFEKLIKDKKILKE